MKRWSLALACLLALGGFSVARPVAPTALRLGKNRDYFFVENDFVYRRFLHLSHDGIYQQINREGATATEVDGGTWEQDSAGILLHFTRHGLRFHVLLAGPLSITLTPPPKPADLTATAGAIRRWLGQTSDVVFAAGSIPGMALEPGVLNIDPAAESFRRADLESILRQVDDFADSEQNQTYRFSLHRSGGVPLLLILRGAVFQEADLVRVLGEYHVPPGKRPPFYFAQVNAETFAREAGSWQKLR